VVRLGWQVGVEVRGRRLVESRAAPRVTARFFPHSGSEGDRDPMIDDVHKEFLSAAAKAHDALKRDLAKLRAGRASTNLLDGVRVDYYGTPTPLAQMANIAIPEARMITVKPWDKSVIKQVEKALRENDLGLNPQTDGDLIRIPLPPLTEERRREFVKIAKKYGEECKVTLRKARHEALDMLTEMDDEGEASQDDVERGKKKAEELVSEAVKLVDQLVAAKEKDIMEV
jgi:ribosome recycling factor